MASESNEIGEIVKKCKILLLDIEGTTTSISFVKDQLFPYAEANVKEFLESQWEDDNVKEAVAALRKLALEDEEQKVEGAVAIPGEDAAKEEQIEGLVKSVKWQMSVDRKAGPLKQLQGLIWKKGYDNGDIKGHVYDDVAPALALWKSTEGQKVYIYSSGSVQAQKLLFGRTSAGDLLPHIEGHFDTAVGAKQEPASYVAIVEKVGCKPEDVLFLTDILKEALAARASGLHAALVVRAGTAPLPADVALPVLTSFDQLAVSNKRKPEPQEQEVPAKIPKTDIEADVKASAEKVISEAVPEPVPEPAAPSESVAASEMITEETANNEVEKMEVEEEIPVTEAATVTEQAKEVATTPEETAVRVETVIEEVTASNEAGDAAVCTLKPIITEESVEKTDKNETEKMETGSEENVETEQTVVEPKELPKENNVEKTAPVAEETPPAVVIEEVTNDQEVASEGIEMADDLVPVVEEPAAAEMEDLNNVADVLDKECDEILLKVHDVTNLEGFPVNKPLLNSIAEEDIEGENSENTNDIVESILDSEMELGVKPCEDIDINIVQEISAEKPDAPEVTEKAEENDKEINKAGETPAETPAVESVVKEASETDEAQKCSESVTEVVKDASVPTTEGTNGDMQESPIDVAPEPEIIAESKAVVESNETKEISTEVADNTADVKVTEPEDNKMEAEESIAVTESKSEAIAPEATEVCTAEPVETSEPEQTAPVSVEKEMKPKEAIEEKLDTAMESEDSPVAEHKDAEIKENNATQIDENKTVEIEENKMESEDSVPQESQAKEVVAEPEAISNESKENEIETPAPVVPEAETESKESASNDVPMETEVVEKVNGNMNGEAEVNQNGDASKDEELSARLSVENGDNDKETNGANGNGDSSEVEKEQVENKETEILDIKVKTVSTDEPRTDPIEQPVEA